GPAAHGRSARQLRARGRDHRHVHGGRRRGRGGLMVDGNGSKLDPDIVRRFHFTRSMIKGPIYRKYQFSIKKIWDVDDLTSTQDVVDWARIDEKQREGLLGVTIRFLAGEQAVTDELVPMIAASHALGRFDWVTYLATFLMEEAKHAQFFMR